jgi:hypothetical protein
MHTSRLLPRVKPQQVMKSTTLRDFNGGWNVLDDDMNLAYKYAKRMENCYVSSDGSIRVRQGTSLFAACAASFTTAAYLVDM